MNKNSKTSFLPPGLLLFVLALAFILSGCDESGGLPTATPTPTLSAEVVGGIERAIPLTDLGTNLYKGFQGGLYPGGSNEMPPEHAQAGLERAGRIQPLTPAGNSSPDGKYVLLSIGMINAAEEFCGRKPIDCEPWTFAGLAANSPDVNHEQLAIVNGAAYGGGAVQWNSPASENYDKVRDNALTPLGLTERQVQIIWLKVANNGADSVLTIPDPQSDAYLLMLELGNILRSMRARYPNLQQVFISSRTYGGYPGNEINPEPYAYESGFGVKWVIESQIEQMQNNSREEQAGNLNYNRAAPWIAWGPYMWADGTNPRSDGLAWQQGDFETDGVRPSPSGEQKVGQMLFDFFSASPFTTPWFLGNLPTVAPPTPTHIPTDTPSPDETPTAVVDVIATPAPTPTLPISNGDDNIPIPLSDMGAATYYGFTGGLYPDGSNVMPLEHAQVGLELANQIQSLDVSGSPSSGGKYVLLAVGMSNAAREFGVPGREQNFTFIGQAANDPSIDAANLVFANGARSGQDAPDWEQPNDYNYNWIRDNQLLPNGLSENQVQVIWLKQANGDARTMPSLPDPEADVYVLMERLGNILRSLKARYPNLRQVFLSSRIYAGYSNDNLNPEPYAYESGFAVKWIIEAQIRQMETGVIDPHAGDLDYNTVAPWIAWGPYMWANGTMARSDGLIWVPEDYAVDGTHPFVEGQRKVGAMLLDFFSESPLTQCWFITEGVCQLP